MEVCEQICPGPSGMPLCVLGVPVDKGLSLSLLHGNTPKHAHQRK